MAIVRTNNNFQILPTIRKLTVVRVTDIILDPSHDQFEKYGNYDSIGTIFYTELNQSNSNTNSVAKPLFTFVKNYPLINELVLITSTKSKDNKISSYYFPILNIWNHPHHNALPYIKDTKNQDYNQTINRKLEEASTNIKLGNYFQEKLNIKPLLPYEGDTIIEGRFGNSIRFGSTNISDKVGTPNGWSNVGELGDPITIIKNGQPQLDGKGWIPNIEDIANDVSSIYMTSNQQLSNFIPASLNQKSFGADLVIEPTIQEQLTGNYEQPIQPVETIPPTQDLYTDTVESFESTPVNLPPTSSVESDDPFADYAEEILDGPGTMEITDISGTDGAGEDNIEDMGDGEIVTEEDIENLSNTLQTGTTITVPSKSYPPKSVVLHPPLSIYDLKTQIELQPIANRVEYLVIHTTAMAYGTTHEKVAKFFMQDVNGDGWSRHGYHTTLDYTGKCIQIYKDDEKSFGVGTAGKSPNQSKDIGNHNTINLNWIGGHVFDLTKEQANALNELVKFYVIRYPNIKILGHNQIYFDPVKKGKTCPWLDVPTYCRELGINSNNIETANPANYPLSKLTTNSINTAKLNLKSA